MINTRIRASATVTGIVCEECVSEDSSSSICNKSEPLLRHRQQTSCNPAFQPNQAEHLLERELSDFSFLSEATWRNPSQPCDVMSSTHRYTDTRTHSSDDSSTSESETGSDTWDETDIRMYPESRVPNSSSSLDEIPDSMLNSKELGSDQNTWLDEKLARDLGSIIMPSFDFTNTSNLFSDRPLFSLTSSETSSQKISYSSGGEQERRHPRHSWAGNLDIIDSDSNTLQCYSASHVSKRRRNSFDRTFSIKKRPVHMRASNSNKPTDNDEVNLKFASQCCVFDEIKSRVPGLKQLIRTKTLSTDLILEKQRIIIKFTEEKEYLCSSIKSQKKKVVLHLLDIRNILVLTDSNTLIIQFKESSKSKQIQDKSTIDKLSDTIRSSKSNSLNRSINSECDADLSEIEVGRFNNCTALASLILRRRQCLVPRSILKRGSFRVKTVEPIIVKPVQLPEPPEFLEFVTYV